VVKSGKSFVSMYKWIIIVMGLLMIISTVSAAAPVAYFTMKIGSTVIVLNTTIVTINPTNTPTIKPIVSPIPVPVSGYGAPNTYDGYALGGSYYGGGIQYPAYTAGVAGGSYDGSTVSTKVRLLEALVQAGDGIGGAVIYIDPLSNIDMGSTMHVKIPANTTIASNRGVNESPGGRIFTKVLGSSWQGRLFETDGVNVRITGLRLEGEAYPENYEPASGEGAEYRIGLTIYHTGCIVDNNDFYGFAYANILTVNIPTSGRPWIHHNYIHGSQNRHEGYGIEVFDGDALVEANVFDRNRHDITGTGEKSERYTFRYNYILGTEYQIVGMSHIDVHGSEGSGEQYSGDRYDIYSNTIDGGSSSAMHQRGLSQGTYVYNNIFRTFSNDEGWTEGNLPVWQSCYPTCVTNNYWSPIKGGSLVLYPTETGIMWYQGG
jgi:hypothetical protein